MSPLKPVLLLLQIGTTTDAMEPTVPMALRLSELHLLDSSCWQPPMHCWFWHWELSQLTPPQPQLQQGLVLLVCKAPEVWEMHQHLLRVAMVKLLSEVITYSQLFYWEKCSRILVAALLWCSSPCVSVSIIAPTTVHLLESSLVMKLYMKLYNGCTIVQDCYNSRNKCRRLCYR